MYVICSLKDKGRLFNIGVYKTRAEAMRYLRSWAKHGKTAYRVRLARIVKDRKLTVIKET